MQLKSWSAIEIPVTDLLRAMRFYGIALGLTIEARSEPRNEPGSFAQYRVPGAGPSLVLRLAAQRAAPASGYVLAFDVDDLEGLEALVADLGGTLFIDEPISGLTIAHVTDPDGNAIELLKMSAQRPAPDSPTWRYLERHGRAPGSDGITQPRANGEQETP